MRLPAGAQTWQDMGVDSAWTPGEHLQALQVDLTASGNWQRAGGKGKRPESVDRPADLKKARDRAERTEERAQAFLAKHGTPAPQQPAPVDIERPRDERGRFVSRKG